MNQPDTSPDTPPTAVLADFDHQTLRQILEQFFVNSFNAILITTAAPGYPILYANPAFCRMSGYSLEELRGQTPKLFQGKKTSQQMLQRLKDNLAAGRSFHGATTNYRKNGDSYPVEWNISAVMSPGGQVSHYISIQKDLSHLKQVVSRFKASNQHFRAFLRDLDLKAADSDAAAMVSAVAEQKQQLTRELLDNTRLYNPALRSDANIALFDETEFFDFGDDMNGMLAEPMAQERISALQYASKHPLPDADLSQLLQIMHEVQEQLDLIGYSSNSSRELSIIAENFQEMANTIFYLEDFISISSILAELSTRTAKHASREHPAFIIETYKALVQDLQTWVSSVFVNKTARDIHELDASIVSSSKQLLMFLP